MPASELERQIALYLEHLARAGNSAHSIRAYEADLRHFLVWLSPPDLTPPCPRLNSNARSLSTSNISPAPAIPRTPSAPTKPTCATSWSGYHPPISPRHARV